MGGGETGALGQLTYLLSTKRLGGRRRYQHAVPERATERKNDGRWRTCQAPSLRAHLDRARSNLAELGHRTRVQPAEQPGWAIALACSRSINRPSDRGVVISSSGTSSWRWLEECQAARLTVAVAVAGQMLVWPVRGKLPLLIGMPV